MKIMNNEIGFSEIVPKPSIDELEKYYNDKYYGNKENMNQYSYEYSEEELFHKTIAIKETLQYVSQETGSLLDLGCGEGFFLHHFHEMGWEVEGADFTNDGISKYFPEIKEKVHSGDLFKTIEKLMKQGKKYDIIICNNVIEHVIDPVRLLKGLSNLIASNGICRVVVPNDNSMIQHEIVKRNHAEPEFWVCSPDHLNYFNADNLSKFIRHCGLKIIDLLADFPIDLFLFNPDSNYKQEPLKGRNCHFAKVAIENFIFNQSIEKLIHFRKGCVKAGIGRDLTVYCTK